MNRLDQIRERLHGGKWNSQPWEDYLEWLDGHQRPRRVSGMMWGDLVGHARDDIRDLLAVAEAAQAWVGKMALVPGGMWPEEAATRKALAALTEEVDRPQSIRELVDRGKP